MKTKETTIKLLQKKEGYANAVDTCGTYQSDTIGKYEWGIFHNGIGVRWFCIHRINKHKFIHVYEKSEEMIEYVKNNIM